MPVRNAVLVQITDSDGAYGWGEIWCNFPPRGNVSRLNLLEDVIGPALLGKDTGNPAELCRRLMAQSARMRIHTGEYGPYRHCLAGIDTALHDLAARKRGVPLSGLLCTDASSSVPVYASSPSGGGFESEIGALEQAGHRAVKLKVGHAFHRDMELLDRFRRWGDGLDLFLDANQAWNLSEAEQNIGTMAEFQPLFVEEPLRADAAATHWSILARTVPVSLAAGENIASAAEFEAKIKSGALGVVQPDLTKWGGVSGAMHIGCFARNRGTCTYLHFMGSALGLAASLHISAALGGEGYVELDANQNPLRSEVGELDLTITSGRLTVPAGSGIGFVPDPDALARLAVGSFELGVKRRSSLTPNRRAKLTPLV